MNFFLALFLFAVGLALVIYFAEKLVKGAVGTSAGFGVSAFIISVVFIGFDPENLAVGAVAAIEEVSGIALGTIIGAAMVAIALAFGITALLVPMTFAQVPRRVLLVPVVAVGVFALLVWDGLLSRVDGAILLLTFALGIAYLFWLSKKGLDIRPTGEVAETLEKGKPRSKWAALGLLALSLVAIVVGSELLVWSSQTIMAQLGLSETVFGMTVLAFLISIEELARGLPAAWKGHPEITYGNVVGSLLAFFCFNAGIIALVRPVPVEASVLNFYLPVCAVTVLVITLFMLWKKVPRWAGIVLVALYLFFIVGGYIGYSPLEGILGLPANL